MAGEIRIGVDTGGTFTDFIIAFEGRIRINKVPSTPDDPSRAILQGLAGILNASPRPSIVHGTTVATNALLEGSGEKIALITTRGFEDMLFIGRQTRKNLYSLKVEKRSPLLLRRHCYGVDERTAAGGKVLKKVAPADLGPILDRIQNDGIRAVAVSLLHSYANPSNERIIKKELRARRLLATLSSEILPEYREYERTTVCTVNTYLMPLMTRYLTSLQSRLGRPRLRIMQSNEGHISPSVAGREPIRTALSGPAGGVVGAFQIGKRAGYARIITFDMGGTSSDVSLVDGGIRRTSESVIGDFPIRLPIIDIHTVGAGGGSLAFMDSGGSLRVGPQSAGAEPGPACYGRGERPTVTDANLVLGRLVPEYFLGGRMTIYPDRSRKALESLAGKIGRSAIETAEGIVAIANANMEKAIRVISIERGFDPRKFSLFSFGGAGGLHAVEMADHLGIPRTIIPNNAGVLSALGLLMADSIKDYSLSLLEKTERLTERILEPKLAGLRKKGRFDLEREGFSEKRISLFPYLDVRYEGQSYEITIPLRGFESIVRDFHKAHQKQYGYHHPDRPTEVVTLRLKAVGRGKPLRLRKQKAGGSRSRPAPFKTQSLYYGGRSFNAGVFTRSDLKPGQRLAGPALILDEESTVFLPPGCRVGVDGFLNLVITGTPDAENGAAVGRLEPS